MRQDVLLARFGLGPLERRQLGGLSGGERRLVAVALAFAGAPELVVLDEPTSGLDLAARKRVWEAIRLHAEGGGSMLLTTHQLEEADALAQRVVLLDAGKVVASGPVRSIKASAGLTRVSYRASSGERVEDAVADAGAHVETLVRHGVRLAELEVRPLTLEEGLARWR
jgi:ABC-2 type transport system ATP-binding protein